MSALPQIAVAERLAERIVALAIPAAVREKCIDLAVDVIGLCVTARKEDYVRATLAACDDDGPCTAIGHARGLGAAGAALVNGETLAAGDTRGPFKAKSMQLTLGNGEIQVMLNGKQVPIPSAANPVGFDLTPQGAKPLSTGNSPTCA